MNWKLSPYIRLAWNDYQDTPWVCGPRVIFDYEIIFLAEGEVKLTVEGNVYHVLPGEVIILRPKQEHLIQAVNCSKIHQPHIHFDLQEDESSPHVYVSFAPLSEIPPTEYGLFRKDILSDLCPNCPSVLKPRDPREIERLMLEIITEYENRMIYSDVIVRGKFLQLLGILMREATWGDFRDHSEYAGAMQQAREYIMHHLDQPIALEELAEKVNMSKYYLCRQFKKVYGISPIQYHLNARIDQAKWLLVHTDESLTAIARDVGFDNIYSFSRAFKNRENIAPSKYRKT